jgi:hypothetical protein
MWEGERTVVTGDRTRCLCGEGDFVGFFLLSFIPCRHCGRGEGEEGGITAIIGSGKYADYHDVMVGKTKRSLFWVHKWKVGRGRGGKGVPSPRRCS